jgi:hypothetical protein
MSHRTPSQGNLPTKPISFEATAKLDLVPLADKQTAHLSETFGIFVENKADARFLPLNMSGFGPSEVRRLPKKITIKANLSKLSI